jgi:hypothetical protein
VLIKLLTRELSDTDEVIDVGVEIDELLEIDDWLWATVPCTVCPLLPGWSIGCGVHGAAPPGTPDTPSILIPPLPGLSLSPVLRKPVATVKNNRAHATISLVPYHERNLLSYKRVRQSFGGCGL